MAGCLAARLPGCPAAWLAMMARLGWLPPWMAAQDKALGGPFRGDGRVSRGR
jgi:hypothetical protein